MKVLIIPDVHLNQMLKGGISDPWNRNMLKMFTLIGVGDRAGSGVPDIYEVWKEEKPSRPDIATDKQLRH